MSKYTLKPDELNPTGALSTTCHNRRLSDLCCVAGNGRRGIDGGEEKAPLDLRLRFGEPVRSSHAASSSSSCETAFVSCAAGLVKVASGLD